MFFNYLGCFISDLSSIFRLESITAEIMNMQPAISLGIIVSLRISTPPITAKTDSKHSIRDAIAGGVYFWPYI